MPRAIDTELEIVKDVDGKKNGENGIYRKYDSSVIQLISAWPKVLQVLKGEIPTPEIAEIFLTNFCNFGCPHCRFRAYHGNNSAYMDITVLERLLDELSQNNVKAIELSGGGEPLAHPQIEQIFDCLIQKRFRVGLITNGYRFTNSKALMKKAIECCNWIRFSVDAFTDETYRRAHGRCEISYQELRQSISNLVNIAGETPKIGLKILISKLNAEDSLLAIKESLELKVDYLQFKFLGYPAELALSDGQIDSLTERIQEQIDLLKGQNLVAELIPAYRGKLTYQKCLMTFLHPVIDWDGEIYVCAFFEHRKKQHSLGNIGNGGFFHHWESLRHKKVFNGIDPATCVPNCPMLRYNPVINFIKNDWYRFAFI